MNKSYSLFLLIIILSFSVLAADFTPSGNINGRGLYTIYNFTTISGLYYYGDASNMTGITAVGLSGEIADRISNDTVINSSLTTEIANRLSNDTVINSSINSRMYLTGSNSNVTLLKFNTSASNTFIEGVMGWDDAEHALSVGYPHGATLQVGQEVYVHVVNTDSVTLTEGMAVSLVGVSGNRVAAQRTNISNIVSASAFVGIVTTEMNVSGEGFVTMIGDVHGLNTDNFTEGLPVYVSTTPGVLTQSLPDAPNFLVMAGIVTVKNANVGIINVQKAVQPRLTGLSDVDGVTINVSGQFLVWNQTGLVWSATSNVNNLLNVTDQRYNETGRIDSLNASVVGNASALTIETLNRIGNDSLLNASIVGNASGLSAEILNRISNDSLKGNLAGGNVWSGDQNFTGTIWINNANSSNTTGFVAASIFYENGVSINTKYNDTANYLGNDTLKINRSGDAALTGSFNLLTGNVTVNSGYLVGQPLTGMLGSGMIQNTGTVTGSELNVSCSGLNCSYSNFTVRLMTGTGTQVAKYCAVPAGSFTAQNDAHNIRYIDSNCAVQVTDINTYFSSVITQGGVWDFSNIMCHSGTCEVVNGIGLENRRMMKQRVIDFYTDHLKVVSGLGFSAATWPNYNIGSGEYIYLMDIAPTPTINTSLNQTELFYHNGTTTGYTNIDITGINVTHCDNGSTIVACTGNNFRRYFIYLVGWNETGHTPAELVQTAALLGTTYTTAASCLDTTTNPLIYNLPSYYTKVAVPLYAYCATRTTVNWNTANLIDLRAVKIGSASGTALETDPVWTSEKANYELRADLVTDVGNWSAAQAGTYNNISTEIANRISNDTYLSTQFYNSSEDAIFNTTTSSIYYDSSNPAYYLDIFGTSYTGAIFATALKSTSDIYTNDTGGDLWLGTNTQGNALFRAYANGSVVGLMDYTNITNAPWTSGGYNYNSNASFMTLNVTNGNINVSNTGSCIYAPGGGKFCGNTTCAWISSPDGLTIMKVANNGTTC